MAVSGQIWSDIIHTITEAKQSNRQYGSQGGGSSSRVIWPGVAPTLPLPILVTPLTFRNVSEIIKATF